MMNFQGELLYATGTGCDSRSEAGLRFSRDNPFKSHVLCV